MLLFMFEYDKYDEANYWYIQHRAYSNINTCKIQGSAVALPS